MDDSDKSDSFSLVADANEALTYDVNDDLRNAKCELLDYLASILSQTDRGKSYVESNAKWHNYECGGD